MEVLIFKNEEAVADQGALLICELLQKKPAAILGLATGRTPILLYSKLIAYFQRKEISFSQVKTFNLDEYYGIPSSHPASYRRFMQDNLFDHIDIQRDNTHLPESDGVNPRLVGPDYELKIKEAGGIDLQILGIGRNGHIGFNEPSSSLASRTRIKTLTETTINDNKGVEEDYDLPEMAITMGIGTITDAQRILLIATGESKAIAIRDALEGPISAMNPASALQAHQYVTVLLDEAAASKLSLQEYYRWVHQKSEDIKTKFGNFYEIDLED